MADRASPPFEEPVFDPDEVQPTASGSSSAPFPTIAARSSLDDPSLHMSYDQTLKAWTYEDPATGQDFVYDEKLQKWKQMADGDEWEQQQKIYGDEGSDAEEEEDELDRPAKRRRQDDDEGEAGSLKAVKKKQPRAPRQNSSLFLSKLPLDATSKEIASVFSRYGILAIDDDGNPRIKLYQDEPTGMFKGEALLTYFKPESCELAINLLDGTCLRAAQGQREPEMKVEMADWSNSTSKKKKQKDKNGGQGALGSNGKASSLAIVADDGSAVGASITATTAPAPAPERTDAERRKAAKRFHKLNEKLSGWDSDSADEEGEEAVALTSKATLQAAPKPSITGTGSSASLPSQNLLLKHLFDPEQLSKAPPQDLQDLQEDVTEELTSFGTLSRPLILWDLEPLGIATCSFSTEQEASRARTALNGRWFDGRKLEVDFADAEVTKGLKRSGGEKNGQDEEEEEKRLEGFQDWLNKGGEDSGA